MVKCSAYTCDIMLPLDSAFPASFKTPTPSIDSIRPNNQPTKSKKSYKTIKLLTNCIKLIWSTYTELRAEKCSPKTGSDKFNMFRQGRKNAREQKSYCTAWTHKPEPST